MISEILREAEANYTQFLETLTTKFEKDLKLIIIEAHPNKSVMKKELICKYSSLGLPEYLAREVWVRLHKNNE